MRRKAVVTLKPQYFKNYMCEMIEPNCSNKLMNNYFVDSGYSKLKLYLLVFF